MFKKVNWEPGTLHTLLLLHGNNYRSNSAWQYAPFTGKDTKRTGERKCLVEKDFGFGIRETELKM